MKKKSKTEDSLEKLYEHHMKIGNLEGANYFRKEWLKYQKKMKK